MNIDAFFPTLRRAAPIVAAFEVVTVLLIAGIGLVLGWQTLGNYGLLFALAGIVLIFLGAVRPLNEKAQLEEEWWYSGAITGEMLYTGVLNIVIGLILLSL